MGFQSKNKSAFTMVELMATLLIVGILLAVCVASYEKYTLKAKMAEAYQGIDAISKAEETYFLTHKKFASLNSNPGMFQYFPGYGKIRADSSWATLGYPYPVGTSVRFNYTVYAGSTDANAQPTAGSNAIGTGVYGIQNRPGTSTNSYFNCTTYLIGENKNTVSRFVTIQDKAQYNWALVQATRQFESHTSNEPVDQLCTQFVKVLETDSHGHLVTGNPIQVLNYGK